LSAIDLLLSLNGWVAALCPTLTRPFGQNHFEDAYDDLSRDGHLFFVAIVIHSADHFLVDQLAVIVQMAKRLGPSNLFVSMLDYTSSDSTETLTDLCEAVLILLGVPFRIRRVPGMTTDPTAAYYPLEEAHMRNMALEPLLELKRKRNIKFHRVVWLKGFTCPNDILETIKVSTANDAAMVCGMDWAEYHGSFIFSDRYVFLNRFLCLMTVYLAGGPVTSTATSSDKLDHPLPSQMRFPLAIERQRHAMLNIFRSKSSVAKLGPTSLILLSHITRALHIVLGWISTMLLPMTQPYKGIRMPLAWIAVSHGSVEIFGSVRPKNQHKNNPLSILTFAKNVMNLNPNCLLSMKIQTPLHYVRVTK
jgi:hypothetical protein